MKFTLIALTTLFSSIVYGQSEIRFSDGFPQFSEDTCKIAAEGTLRCEHSESSPVPQVSLMIEKHSHTVVIATCKADAAAGTWVCPNGTRVETGVWDAFVQLWCGGNDMTSFAETKPHKVTCK